jgi:hypothetical protein
MELCHEYEFGLLLALENTGKVLLADATLIALISFVAFEVCSVGGSASQCLNVFVFMMEAATSQGARVLAS